MNTTTSTQSIGERLRVWRKSQSLTQEALAAKLGVYVTTLRKYEGGATTPNGTALVCACQIGLNINWLLLAEGTMIRRDVIKSFSPELQQSVSTLADALLSLSQVDPAKFTMLARGFAARSEEALRLAKLEQKERDTGFESNSD